VTFSSAELMQSVQSRIIYSIVYGRSSVGRFSCISNWFKAKVKGKGKGAYSSSWNSPQAFQDETN